MIPTSRSTRARRPGPCLAGFEGIRRTWSPGLERIVARVLPGEYYVTRADEGILTVLGSCVSACVYDKEAGIGGLNHFMLPESTGNTEGNQARFGAHAMELLINALLREGARRDRLVFKLFGGGRIIRAMSDIGQRNIEFVTEYLTHEGFRVASQDLGDRWARKIVFLPQRGLVRCRRIRPEITTGIGERDVKHQREIATKPRTGGIELFD